MIYWIASIALIVSMALPRKFLHLVGVVGCSIMTWRVYSYSQDGPQIMLNLACAVVHLGMLIKIWFWGNSNG